MSTADTHNPGHDLSAYEALRALGESCRVNDDHSDDSLRRQRMAVASVWFEEAGVPYFEFDGPAWTYIGNGSEDALADLRWLAKDRGVVFRRSAGPLRDVESWVMLALA